MAAHRIQLQNVDGSHCRWTGAREIQDMIASNSVMRITNRRDAIQAYRKRVVPQCSESRASHSTPSVADTRALAGLHRVDEIWVERLIGFKLLPEGTTVPQSGFLI